MLGGADTLMIVSDEEQMGSGAQVAGKLRDSGALDELFARVQDGCVALTGSDGLGPALLKEALEAGLRAELDEYLGCAKGEPTPVARGNSRNGTTSKIMD